MPLTYIEPPATGALCQGEILTGAWELRVVGPTSEPGDGEQPRVRPIPHPLVVVLNADCDLEWDFKARFPTGGKLTDEELDRHSKTVPYIFVCDLYDEGSFRPATQGESWSRVTSHQNERYHMLRAGPVGEGGKTSLPEPLFMDFKKTVALPTASLYQAIATEAVRRLAVVPPVYVHDLVQRYYSFLARIGLPE